MFYMLIGFAQQRPPGALHLWAYSSDNDVLLGGLANERRGPPQGGIP